MKLPSFSWLHNRTARRYLHSYLLISIIPVVFIVLVFCIFSVSSLRLQAQEDMQLQLDRIKSEMDTNIGYMDGSMSHFSQLLTVMQDEDDGISDSERARIAQQLTTYQQNFHLHSTPIYFPRRDTVVYTVDGEQSYSSFQKGGPWRDQLDMAQFFIKLNTVSSKTLTDSRKSVDQAGDYLIYMAPVPDLDPTPMGTAAFLIEKRQIDLLLQTQLGEFDGYFLMYDNFYGLAYACGPEENIREIAQYVNLPTGGSAIIQHDVADRSYVMMRSVSSNYGFTYFYAVSSDAFYAPIRERIMLYVSLGAAVVLLLLIAAFLSTAHSIRPIRKLAEDLLNANPPQADLFEQISSQYRSMEAQNDSLQEQIQLQYTLSRQRMLTTLLYGWRGSRNALDKTLAQVDISFSYPDFFVAAVQLNEERDPQEVLTQVFEQPWAVARPWNIYLLETNMPGTAALLFNLERQPELRQLVSDEVAELLQESGCTRAKIGAGGYRDDPMNIGASYCEALVALQDSSAAVSLFQKPDTSRENYLCPQVEGKIFQQSLLSGSREMALELLRQMTDEVRAHNPPFHTERCFCFFVVNLILQVKSSLNVSFSEDEMIYMAANADLDQFLSFSENMIIQICLQVEESRSSDQARVAEEILLYIKENFGDYSLSVEQLTSRFGLSERTIRQILREHTGGGLTSYLTTLRMNWIKQQLAETDTPIRELIAKVGYTDVSSFTRKFKLLEGMTPGQYRAMARSDQHP